MPTVKVKTKTATHWDGKRVEAGQTLEIPEQVLEMNPAIFEPAKEKPAAAEQPKGDDSK